MHKFVKEFIETELSFEEIFKRVGDPNQPVENVLPKMSAMTHTNNPVTLELEQSIDEAINHGHSDDEVYILFISILIVFCCIHNKKEKCESAYRIGNSLNIKKFNVEVQAVFYQSCSYYFHLIKDFEKRDELNFLVMKIMPKNNPRYYKVLSNVGQILGIEGRLKILPTEDYKLLEVQAEKHPVTLGCFLINSMFTVNFGQIEKYISRMFDKFNKNIGYSRQEFEDLLDILKGNFEEKEDYAPILKEYVAYYQALKKGDLNAAKKIYGSIPLDGVINGYFGVFHFIHYQHAFVIGRYEIIENLIKDQQKTHYHFMFDFFLARYFLVKDKKDIARYYYAQFLKNCEKFDALGRLKFELQFAYELNGLSLFELTQPIQNPIPVDIKKSLAVDLLSLDIKPLGLGRIIGNSKSIMEIKKKVEKFANIQRPILVIGETGAGKEVVARAIHEESSHKTKPFLAINCGALTDTLLQSELFGYEAGAFTGAVTYHKGIFEAAEDGVVFLDEFGEMSPKLQVSLLRVLENDEVMRVGGTKAKKINCRIIAATNANIEELISQKLFREDLYHRLKQFTITIPPLRERKEDIEGLIHYFLNQQLNTQKQEFSKDLLKAFQDYNWPGNIRELKNEVDRIKILCGYKPVIEVDDIEIEWLNKKKSDPVLNSPKVNQTEDLDDVQMHERIVNKKLKLADKRNQKIIALFKKYKQLTRSQIAEGLEISLLTATRDLQRLCNEGVIVKKMPTLSPQSHYFELVEDKK